MWIRIVLTAVALSAATASGCVTQRESAPPGLNSARAQHSRPTQAWMVMERGSRVGSVVRYENVEAAERFFYVVRNRHDQDLGLWSRRPGS